MTENLGTFRTIQVKIIIFFTISFVVLGTVLTFTAVSNNNRVKALYDARIAEEQSILNHDLDGIMQLTKTFAPDYSQWDDPYLYLLGKKPEYPAENMTPDTLERFTTDGMWMFRSDATQVSEVINANALKNPVNFKPYNQKIKELFAKNYSIQFYIKVPEGVLSIYGSTVVKGDDIQHSGNSPGYLLVGKLINNETLEPLQGEFRNLVRLIGPETQSEYPHSFAVKTGKLAYEVTYKDINNIPIGRVYANYFSSSIAALHNSDDMLLIMNMLSFLVLLVMLLICIWRWVIKPASDVYSALETVDRDLLKKKAQEKSEFGKIAELIDKFFDQEKNLENEIEAKKQLLDKLAAYNSEIEHTNSIMIGRELKMIEMKKKLADLEQKLKGSHNG